MVREPDPTEHHHHVGEPVQFFENTESDPVPAQILLLHEDGHTACLIAWCHEEEAYVEYHQVPHGGPTEDCEAFYKTLHEDDRVY